jgi:large subunit ribosomal protein L17
MRHGKRFNHLGRTASHRKAMLSNMASSLFVNKRISTTLAKAKALRKYVEPLITKAKSDTTHSRRVVFSYLQDKESVSALFNEVVDRVADRPGGYTRIIKLGTRLGDNAEMAMIELVDFNDLLIQEAGSKKTRTRRSRRGPKTEQTASPKDKVKTEAEKEPMEAESEEKQEADKLEDGTDTKVEKKEIEKEVEELKSEDKAKTTDTKKKEQEEKSDKEGITREDKKEKTPAAKAENKGSKTDDKKKSRKDKEKK